MKGFNNSQPANPENVSNAIIALGAAIALVIVGAIIFFGIPLGTETENVAERNFYTTPEFSSPDGYPAFLPQPGEVDETEQIVSRGIPPKVTLLGRVIEVPSVDSARRDQSFLVEFKSGAEYISSRVVLGQNDSRLSVGSAISGFIDPSVGITYEPRRVSEVVPFILEGDPIYITIPILNEAPEVFMSGERECDEYCQSILSRIISFYDGNMRLVNSIRLGRSLDSVLTVGPASRLILYNK